MVHYTNHNQPPKYFFIMKAMVLIRLFLSSLEIHIAKVSKLKVSTGSSNFWCFFHSK